MGGARRFGSWRLRGGRYEQHGLPVDALSEFSRYEHLVIEVARGLFKQSHTARQRVPRGFTANFSLRLTSIEQGSVIPVLEVAPQQDPDLLDLSEEYSTIFDEARLLIQETFKAVAEDKPIPLRFPRHALGEFARFGRSLRDGEYILFDEGRHSEAVYSQPIRRALQNAARLERVEVERVVVGQVTGVYADEANFRFRLAGSGKVITGHFSSSDLVPELKQHLDVSSLAPSVALSAVAIESISEEIVEIQDVQYLEPVLPSAWSERLQQLAELHDGWLDGSGNEITRSALRQAEVLLLRFLDGDIPPPSIFPTEKGGVQFEWSSPSGELLAEITPDETVEAYRYSKKSSDEDETTFRWAEIERVIEFLRGGVDDYIG